MIPLADTPTLGLLIGLPVAGLILLACLAVVVYGFFDKYDGLVFIVSGAVCALFTVGITALVMWPFKHDYHYWVDKGGKVEAVSKRLVPTDNGMQEKYVFTIAGRPYGVLDTRASLTKPGDVVDIACKRIYEWGSKDHGWDCKWNGGGE